MNHKKTKLLLTAGLLLGTLLFAGCGNSLDDQFPFGKNRIHCDNETITISTPFELVSNGKQVDLGARDVSKVNAEGHNAHLQILVTGNRVSDDVNETKLASEAEEVLKKDSAISNLKSSKKSFTSGDIKGTELVFTLTESSKGRKTDLTVQEYIFTQKNTVWRVIYQYRSSDETGWALADRVAGKIALGSEF
ncbi:hypothetical protein [uncultured Dialister sp.]|jgi:hypothetical protein|uniref:hypothetical protein n=1 Tax=uncultured Dialister sp. TaxID=278064 RepID=UPI0025FC9CF9|nr:hypothetical protein [uncultured Dialister sp.]